MSEKVRTNRKVLRRFGLRVECAEWSSSRILAGLAYPGYGMAFSRHVLDDLAAHASRTVPQSIDAVYGYRIDRSSEEYDAQQAAIRAVTGRA